MKKQDLITWTDYDDGSSEAEFEGLRLSISEGLLGISLTIMQAEPYHHRGIPGCPSVEDAKSIAHEEALKSLKELEKNG